MMTIEENLAELEQKVKKAEDQERKTHKRYAGDEDMLWKIESDIAYAMGLKEALRIMQQK